MRRNLVIEAFGSFAQELGGEEFVTLQGGEEFVTLHQSDEDLAEPDFPNGQNYSLMTYMSGMYFRARILRDGYESAIAWATPLAKGRMNEVLKKLAPFLPSHEQRNIERKSDGPFQF